MWWLWAIEQTGRAADGCSPNDDVRVALQEWLEDDVAATSEALRAASEAFACSGPVEPQTLARYWLVEGAVLHGEGDVEAAGDNFVAARRVAPAVWLPDLGDPLRALWDGSVPSTATGTIVIEPSPGPRPVWVDGQAFFGDPIPAGVHLVQVGEVGATVASFASTVWVGPGVAAVLDSGLPEVVEAAPEPVVAVGPVTMPAAPVPTPREPPVRFELHLLTGASTAVGEELVSGERREPGVKVAIPAELGLGLRGGPMFARVQLGGAWLVGGRYLGAGASGPVSLPARIDAGLGVGAGTDRVQVGVAGGVQWPSRVAGRLLLGWSPVDLLFTELRLGANLPTERSPEPAGELLIGFRR